MLPAVEGSETFEQQGERLIQYATENLVTEILIHSQLNTLHQCMKNLLSSFTKHRHIIHAGYTFAGNGSWILQDGTLSISDLVEALQEPEVTRVLKAYENSVSIDIHCASEGDWTTERFQNEPVSKLCNVRVNPGDIMTAGNPSITKFIEYLSPFLEPANIQELLQPTDVVGNIRFTHPTLYVFPGGQGDAALFGINGFNMLIDGGFARKACFWDFARHLDRLDAVLLTRLNNSTVSGISAVLQRKKMNHVYPQIGHFFCNLQDRKIALSPDGDKDKDSLIVNLAEEGQEIVANLRHLALKPHPCYRDGNQVDPVNLYHKVGHGKLDMYIISPARDSQAVKDFLAKWTSNDRQLFSNTGKKVGGKAFEFPLQNLVSICALLVWQPANPNDTITRILFPGSTPQHKIFEGLEKLRHLEFLKHSVCSARSISPSASTIISSRSASKPKQPKIIISDNKQKEAKTSVKSQVKPLKIKPEKTEKISLKEAKPKVDTNRLMEEKKETETTIEDPLKKLDNRILSKDEQIENIKKEIHKIEQQAGNEEQKKKIIHRSKYDMRNVKSKVDSRAPSKSIDRKKISDKQGESESSPPSTPKKGITNGIATKGEKAKILAKVSASPLSTPAKSAKEANNRKVVEARVTSTLSNKSLPKKKEETISTKERKPLSRRPKGPTSPVKSAPNKPAKADAESLPKKIIKKPIIDSTVIKSVGEIIAKKPIEDAEIKKTDVDEQKVNNVEIRKVEAETTENKETDAMAVKTEYLPADSQDIKKDLDEEDDEDEEDSEEGGEEEEEEYLIVTKEESTEDFVRDNENVIDYESYQEDMQRKDETEEGEMKKLLREEEESEKKREPLEEIKAEQTNKYFNEQNNIIDKMNEGKEEILAEEKVADQVCEKSEERIRGIKEGEVQKIVDSTEGIEPGNKDHKEGESLPEEKVSNTVETSATTAPTLPEDEKLDEPLLEKEKSQAEDIVEVVEEKYIQEETKEEKKPEIEEENLAQIVQNNIEVEEPPIIPPRSKKPRDVVKTPDEVADLPVHEEVDPRMYSSGLEFTKDFQKKTEEKIIQEEEIGETKPDFKAADKGEANLLDEEEPANESPCPEKKEESTHRNSITSKYLNIIDELEKSASDSRRESPEPSVNKDERLKKVDDRSETSTLPNQKYADVIKFIEEEKQKNLEEEDAKLSELEEGKPHGHIGKDKENITSQEIGTSELNEKLDNIKLEEVTLQALHNGLENSISKDLVDGNVSIISEKISQPTEEEKSGKETPDLSGKISPQNLEQKISRKNSLQQPETCELNTAILKEEVLLPRPETLQNVEKLDLTAAKSIPHEQLRHISGGNSPTIESDTKIFEDKAKAEKDENVPTDLENTTPMKIEAESMSDKEPNLSQNLIEEKAKEVLMDLQNTSKNILAQVPAELPEKLPSLEMIKSQSGRSTPLEEDKNNFTKLLSGEISKEASKPGSPHDLDHLSDKSTLQIEDAVRRESQTSISGKTSPQVEEPVRRESQISITGKISPQVEEAVRRESQISITGKSSPQMEEAVRRESQISITGKISPQIEEPVRRESKPSISGKSSPQTEETVRRESQISITGKISPQVEEPVRRESKPSISGKSSPQTEETVRRESQISITGKISPQVEEPVRRESKPSISGKSSPQTEEAIRRESQISITGKISPQEEEPVRRESKPSISGKSSPQTEEAIRRESQISITGKISPQVEEPVRRESKPSISGKSSPQTEEAIRRESQISITGKISPQEEEPVRRESKPSISGKSSPQTEEAIRRESQISITGKTSPQVEETVRCESKPSISGKSSPQMEEAVRRESQISITGKSSPQMEEAVRRESKPSISGKSSPQTEEAIRRESQISITGKTSPQVEEPVRRESKPSISGKSSPQMEEAVRLESRPSISGKSSPQTEEAIRRESQISITGKTSPHLEETVRRESKPSISGKSSPQMEEVVRRESQISISGKSTPQIEEAVHRESKPSISGKQSPQTEEAVRRESQISITGKISPQVEEPVRRESKSNISGKSTPQIEEAVHRESRPSISGKSSPQVDEVLRPELQTSASGKSTPQVEDAVRRESQIVITGKISPQLEEAIRRESKPSISGKSSPQIEEAVRRESPTSISGKSTPQIEESVRPDSKSSTLGQSSLQELDRNTSELGISVATENKGSEKTTAVDIHKNLSHENTAQDLVKDLQDKSTAHDFFENKDISEDVSLREKRMSPNKVVSSVSDFQDALSDFNNKISTSLTDEIGEVEPDAENKKSNVEEEPHETIIQQQLNEEKNGRTDSHITHSIAPENNVLDKSAAYSSDKKTHDRYSPAVDEKLISDSVSTVFAEKEASATSPKKRRKLQKSSSPSPVDISPISVDKIKEISKEVSKEKRVIEDEKETDSVKSIDHQKEGGKLISENLYKNPLERLKYEEGESSGTSSPEKSIRETSDISVTNGIESEEELEKGTLESERQEKESQILDVSSGEEEELKGLGVDDEDDSEQELRREKDNFEEENIVMMSDSRAEIAKGEKDDLNKLVKIGNLGRETEEDLILDKQKGVRRMLVTASSEDGGTEIEISLQEGAKSVRDTEAEIDSDVISSEDEFKNLIIQAKKEYISQKLRKTSCNSADSDGNEKDEAEDLESVVGESENEKEEELSTLLQQARQELEFVRSKSRESQILPETEKISTKTTTTSETTQINDNDIITITTILTEERTEQEDGSIKLTTTKETKTKGGKNEGTVVVVNTKIEKKTEEKDQNGFSSLSQESKNLEEKILRGSPVEPEFQQTARQRSSIPSVTSQREIVFRRDPGKLEDIRRSSGEIGPLKTTYITSHGDSESLKTSSFYGDMPSEEIRRGRGYESYTEINPSGEKTERTYLYRAEEEPLRVGRDGSRFVRAYYTEDRQSDPRRLVYRYYTSDIPEEATEEETMELEHQDYEEGAQATEVRKKYRFVECSSPELAAGHIEFSKAIDEHISTRGEFLGKEIRQDISLYANGKEKSVESEEAIEEEEEEKGAEEASAIIEESDQKSNKKDVIENWGKPLGLPLPPKNINKPYAFPGQNISTTSSLSTPTDNSDSVTNWGQPMNLPSPAPPLAPNGVAENIIGKIVNGDKNICKTEKKVKKAGGDTKGSGSNTPNRRSESPVKQTERRTPSVGRTSNKSASSSYLYLDLTYVPHHGNSYYSNVEFFKKVRARYYVFSGTEPSKDVYNALLEAKQTWEDKKLEVTIIPTYDTDVLGYWVAENEEILAKHKIDLSPSASRCTINLQDHETSCSAYRLEF